MYCFGVLNEIPYACTSGESRLEHGWQSRLELLSAASLSSGLYMEVLQFTMFVTRTTSPVLTYLCLYSDCKLECLYKVAFVDGM